MSEIEPKVRERARRELDGLAHDLDELTVARLRAARRRALDRPRAWSWGWNGVAAAGLATAALAVVLVAGHLWLNQTPAPLVVVGLEDLEMLSAREQPEFFSELDFYDWLAHRRNGTG